MAKLQKDILSEEERLSGFDVGEPDDDTFALGNSDYIEDIEEIFDIPKEPEQISDIDTGADYKVLKNVVEQSDKPEVSVAESPEDVSVPTPPKEAVLVMDDDFKDFVKDLLDKDKVQTVKPSLPVDDTPIVDNYDHDKELSGAEKIYLDEIAPDDKDTDTDDSNASAAAVPLIVEMPQSDEAKEDAKKDDEEDEKKRKVFPILLIAGIVAALLLISLSVIYFVYLPLSDQQSEIATDTAKTIQESPPAQVEKEAEPVAVITIDSVEQFVEPEPETMAEVMVEKKLDVPPSKPQAAPVKPVQQPKAKTTTEAPKVQTDKVIADKTHAAKTEIPKAKEAPKKHEDLVSIIPERKTETKQPFVRDNVKEEFTVQIYASPSKEDANRWLEKLRAKSVNDAFISEQMIRDVKWYRVRFGTYDTREEARAAALRYGFAQTWIDRVK
ncbi:MAG: SPOR domain-containing protein [Candidatus Kapabacteria bacterium]|nr:SPOR domain-containing protein [Candidatus Kapabacteria bacterium]